jgi:transposase-like protein
VKYVSAHERLAALNAYVAAVEAGERPATAARKLGVSPATIYRWQAEYRAGGLQALAPGKSSGRRPLAEMIPPEGVRALRALYLKTKSVRLSLDLWAADPACPEALRERLLATRDVPPSLMRLVTVHAQVRAAHQGERHLQLGAAVNLRDMTELMPTGERRAIQPGDWWELDDMSLNHPYCFPADPEDYPDDPMVAKYGLALARQSLWAVDVASGKWLGFELVGRRRDAYRAEDILRFLRRLFQTHGLPRRGLRLERGIWKSKRIAGVQITPAARREYPEAEAILAADYERPEMPEADQTALVGGLSQLGIHVVHTWSPRGKAIIEGSFDHLQDIANAMGHK